MTIEQLLSLSTEELEKMTDAEKEAFFAPYLKFIRPSAIEPKGTSGTKKTVNLPAPSGAAMEYKASKKQTTKALLSELKTLLGE